MRHLSLLLPLVLSAACFEEPAVIHMQPPPDDSPALDAGVYELQVVAVDNFSCDGMRARDLIGMEMQGIFGRSGKKASFDLQGIPMNGHMKNGLLSLAGGVDYAAPVPMDEPTEPVSDPDDPSSSEDPNGSTSSDDPSGGGSRPDCGDSGSSNGSGGSSGGSSGSSEPSSGSSGGSTPPDGGDNCGGTEPAVFSMEAVMEMEVLSAHLAEGSLWYQASDGAMSCSFEVQVVMAFVGDNQEPPPVVYEEGSVEAPR